MSNINWGTINLKANPFSIIPDRESKGLIWAGFESNKELLQNAIKNLYSSRDTKVVLNVSRWGGGKTHSAYYFSNNENLQKLLPEGNEPPLSIVIITSKEGNDAAYDFFKKVVEVIDISKICGVVRFIRKSEGNAEALTRIKQITGSEPLSKIIWLLGSDDEEESFEAAEMLFNGTSSAQRKKYKLIRGIEDTTDRFKILSAFFKLLTEYDSERKFNIPRKIFLWMDEIESLIVYTPKQYIPFTQAIRELIDMTPYDFCFLMNFSLSDYDNLRTLEYIIGKALSDRISFRNVFAEPSVDEAFSYVQGLLTSYRIDSESALVGLYPFTSESLKNLFDKMLNRFNEPLMPRNINKYVEYVIDAAFRDAIIENNNLITEQFVNNLDFKELNITT